LDGNLTGACPKKKGKVDIQLEPGSAQLMQANWTFSLGKDLILITTWIIMPKKPFLEDSPKENTHKNTKKYCWIA
jgi:hypothetical protein